jgi:hypothetical protein
VRALGVARGDVAATDLTDSLREYLEQHGPVLGSATASVGEEIRRQLLEHLYGWRDQLDQQLGSRPRPPERRECTQLKSGVRWSPDDRPPQLRVWRSSTFNRCWTASRRGPPLAGVATPSRLALPATTTPTMATREPLLGRPIPTQAGARATPAVIVRVCDAAGVMPAAGQSPRCCAG